MQLTTKGLILREIKTGESDRILTILTPENGVISAAAKASMRPKNKLFSATGLFGYSDFTLFEGRTMFQVNEASSIELFFGIREDIESLALATYLAELVRIFSPTGTEAESILQLTLNSFYLLANHKKSVCVIKPVFELRSFAESGFMPNLVACEKCGKYEDVAFHFDVKDGSILCLECSQRHRLVPNIDGTVLAALRHIVFSDAKKIFNFEISEEPLQTLQKVVEEYMLSNIEYPPKSLSFYKSLF